MPMCAVSRWGAILLSLEKTSVCVSIVERIDVMEVSQNEGRSD